jgi:hypothetical protein
MPQEERFRVKEKIIKKKEFRKEREREREKSDEDKIVVLHLKKEIKKDDDFNVRKK